jgi:hypothetical protein
MSCSGGHVILHEARSAVSAYKARRMAQAKNLEKKPLLFQFLDRFFNKFHAL